LSRLARPPCPTLFPYTTLFRSLGDGVAQQGHVALSGMPLHELAVAREDAISLRHVIRPHRKHDDEVRLSHVRHADSPSLRRALRSEEHTSELQSRGHLVCRLLL